jgi:large subunit ribosomal protein L9
MQVILQVDVPSLGKAGEVVKVREGYGRNFLIPQKKAVLADIKNLTMLEHQKRVVSAKQLKLKRQAQELLVKLSNTSITIARDAGEDDKLFGSVTTKDIVDTLRREGFEIDRHSIHLDAPIKSLGVFDVPVKLHAEVSGALKVWVVKK